MSIMNAIANLIAGQTRPATGENNRVIFYEWGEGLRSVSKSDTQVVDGLLYVNTDAEIADVKPPTSEAS